jgi:hypothetical protein
MKRDTFARSGVGDQVAHVATAAGGKQQFIAPDLAGNCSVVGSSTEKSAGAVTVRADVWRLPCRGELRSVELIGPKLEVTSHYFFPNPALCAPAYAAEFVCVDDKPVVAIVDAVSLHFDANATERAAALMREARSSFAVPQSVLLPLWYSACRSGDDFFCWPQTHQEHRQVQDAHTWLLPQVLRLMSSAARMPINDRLMQAAAIARYKAHHHTYSPSRLLMHKQFGVDWTEQFMKKVVFA